MQFHRGVTSLANGPSGETGLPLEPAVRGVCPGVRFRRGGPAWGGGLIAIGLELRARLRAADAAGGTIAFPRTRASPRAGQGSGMIGRLSAVSYQRSAFSRKAMMGV